MDLGAGLLVGLVVTLVALCIVLVRRENRGSPRRNSRYQYSDAGGSGGAMGGAGAMDSGCGSDGGGGGGDGG